MWCGNHEVLTHMLAFQGSATAHECLSCFIIQVWLGGHRAAWVGGRRVNMQGDSCLRYYGVFARFQALIVIRFVRTLVPCKVLSVTTR